MMEALIDAVADTLPEVKAKALRNVQAKAFSETLSDSLAEVKFGKFAKKLTDLKTASPVLTLFPTLAVMKPAHRSAHPA